MGRARLSQRNGHPVKMCQCELAWCSALGVLDGDPDVRIFLRLTLHETIACCFPRTNFVREIVENEIAAAGLDRQNGMALVVVIPDDGHQQGLTRKASFAEKLALLQGVDLAITLAVIGIIP